MGVGALFDLYFARMIEGEKSVRYMLDERDRLALDLKGASDIRITQIRGHISRLDEQIDHYIKRVEMYAKLVEIMRGAL